jgi:DNA-binding IclR family transcriptional regulator
VPAAPSKPPIPGASSARKVLKLLTYFTPERTHARVDDLATHIDAPKSTTYRYLSLLKEMGLVSSRADGRWYPAPQLIRIGDAAKAAVGFIEHALPVMEKLSRQTQETVLLIERMGDSGVCVAKHDATQMIRLSFDVGTAVPLHRGAGAKLLLAHLAPHEQEGYLAYAASAFRDLKGQIPNLRKELAEIPRAGYAVSIGDLVEGLWSVSAPVRRGDEVVAALSLVGPVFRMPQSAEAALARAVTKSADEVSRAIGRLTRA